MRRSPFVPAVENPSPAASERAPAPSAPYAGELPDVPGADSSSAATPLAAPQGTQRALLLRTMGVETLADLSVRSTRRLARVPGVSMPVLEAARPYIGVTDRGNNSGEQVEAWQARLGHGPGTEWCGHFAAFALDEGGAILPQIRTAWATSYGARPPAAIKASDMRHAPHPGWLAVNDYERGGGHVDIVGRDTTGWPRWIGTVGGNVSGGGCTTCGVFEGKRSTSPENRMAPEYYTPTICTGGSSPLGLPDSPRG